MERNAKMKNVKVNFSECGGMFKPCKHGIDAGKLNHDGYISVAHQICERFGCKKVAITLRGSISASDNDWAAMLTVMDKRIFYLHTESTL